MPAREACGVSRGRSSAAVSSVRWIKSLLLFSHCSESDITAEVTAVANAVSQEPCHSVRLLTLESSVPQQRPLSATMHTRPTVILGSCVCTLPQAILSPRRTWVVTALKQAPAGCPLPPAPCSPPSTLVGHPPSLVRRRPTGVVLTQFLLVVL